MKICVLIPCYNEGTTIREVTKGILEYLPEAIVVDDGSSDNTYHEALDAGARVLRHEQNKGKGAAINTGFEYILGQTDWEAVIVMDGDKQHDWHEIPLFVDAAKFASIVVGNRMDNAVGMPFIRLATNKVTSWILSKLARCKIPDSQCGYRLYKREILENIEIQSQKYDAESEILLKAAKQGYSISAVPVKSIYLGEVSYINPFKDTIRFFRLIKKWFR